MLKHLLILLLPLGLTAQNQHNNWFFGSYLGMHFSQSGMQVVPPKTSSMYAPYGSSSYSDPVTGDLLFYTSGSYVYNRFHQQMPNGFNINDDTYSVHNLIVPVPGSKRYYYIFTSPTAGARIYYCKVDMQLDNGKGDVIESRTLLGNGFDLQFTIVKQLYDNGYWLITHREATNQFHAYRVGKNGVDPNPVVSSAGKPSYPTTSYLRGKMISSSDGTKLIFTAGSTLQTDCFAQLFHFDKRCGIVTAGHEFPPQIIQAAQILAFPAFSANDQVVYMSWLYNSGQHFLVQYDLTDPTPFPIIITGSVDMNGDMQLAPDGKIYVASSENGAVTSRISTIQNPDQVGTSCNFEHHSIDLQSGAQNGHFTEHFPSFMMDLSPQKTGYVKPGMRITNLCLGDQSAFALNNSFYADSIKWDLGDGTVSRDGSFDHAYAAAGSYTVTFNWYLCGMEYSIDTVIKIGPKPVVDLGKDSTLCAGNALHLIGPPGADGYEWSTGETGQSIVVKEPGTYTLRVRNGGCSNQDEINIGHYPSIWTALGDEYFICDDAKELTRLDAGEGFTSYKWTPTGDSTQWIEVASLGEYFVVVKDFRGCNGNDVTKVKRRCPVVVHFPNAFTPNEDGINDLFDPSGKDVTAFEMTIYNAWGEAVFNTHSIDKRWDGMYAGKASPTGVYIYKAHYSGYRNKKIVEFDAAGNVTLIR